MKVLMQQVDEDRFCPLFVLITEDGSYWSEDLERFSTRAETYDENTAKVLLNELQGWLG